jgi:hypothetical protein
MDVVKALKKDLDANDGANTFFHEMNIQQARELEISDTDLAEALDNAQADVFAGSAEVAFLVIVIKA